MSLSMYSASVPTFTRALANLSAILQKAAAYAQAKKIDPSVLITARLAPDMFPLARQVQIATDMVKGCASRLAGVEIPSYADTEASFEELQERISKTITYLNSFKAEQINGTETKTIHLKTGSRELEFTGETYLLYFVIPNFHFHLTTAYGILRHNGLDIGKLDYLGRP